jgi:hypothetical protein
VWQVRLDSSAWFVVAVDRPSLPPNDVAVKLATIPQRRTPLVIRRKLMMMPLRMLAAITGVALAASAAAQPAAGGGTAPPPYRPGLGDLMTATVQPRHVKLAFAGRQKNWSYAAYELHELDEAFDRLAAQWPQWQRVRIAELIETMIRAPIDDLGQAIEAKDEARYASAYGKLTDACNACHQAAKRPFVVIQEPGENTPKESMFPDQDFRPQP